MLERFIVQEVGHEIGTLLVVVDILERQLRGVDGGAHKLGNVILVLGHKE
jgi:hypothetical protein